MDIRRDTDAGIFNRHLERLRRVGLPGDRNPHVDLASQRELDGIAEQIEENLPQAHAVAPQARRHLGRNVDTHLQTLLVRAARKQANGVVDQFAHVDRLRLDRKPPSFDLRVVEQVVQNLQQGASGLVDHAEHFALIGIQVRALQHFDQPKHTVHRRADFVAHHRKEVVLGA